ncbi:MAG TPA: hypothetical protein VM123_20530 [archaeon]|nr:hypothetical protein [archaeon]
MKMNCHALFFFILAGIIFSSVDHACALDVWAVGDGVRIDPESGRAIEGMQTFFGPVIESGCREKNWVWDSYSRTISLKAACNEVVSCQLIIATDRPVRGVSIGVSGLESAGGASIPASQVRLFREWYILLTRSQREKGVFFPLKTGWYPDALIPLDAQKHGAPFDIPGEDFYSLDEEGKPFQYLTTQTNQAVWMDLYVPDSASAGKYRGTLQVSAGGEPDLVLSMELEVFDFTIPDEFHTTWEILDYGRLARGPEELELKTWRMAQSHRLTLCPSTIGPELVGEGYGVKFDWRQYDQRWGRFFDGSAFVEGPGRGQPVKHIVLPIDARIWREDKGGAWKGRNWPFPMPGDSALEHFTPEYEAALKRILLEFERHFNERGWTETRIYFFPGGVDEPGPQGKELRLVRRFGEILKESGAGRIKYRTDIDYGLSAAVDLDVDGKIAPGTRETVSYLKDVVDLWNCHGVCLVPEVLNMRPGSPWTDVWFYNGYAPAVGTNNVNGESLGFRTWMWIAWKNRIGGVCDWEFAVTGGRNVFRRMGKSEDLSGSYLRVMYIYPGEQIGLPGEVLPSIRLKMMRRSIQDYEYFWLLTRKNSDSGAAADRIVSRIIRRALRETWPFPGDPVSDPGSWSHRPEDWYRARLELAEQIMR